MRNYEKRLTRLTEQLKTDKPDKQPMIDKFMSDINRIYGDKDQPPTTIPEVEFDQVLGKAITKVYGGEK